LLPQNALFLLVTSSYSLGWTLITICVHGTAFGCLTEDEVARIDSPNVTKILLKIERTDEKERDAFIENCKISIYDFAKKILISDFLTDEQKLDYYLRIEPLFPNNAEVASVLGYDIIKTFMKYKKKPLEEILDSIKDPILKGRIKAALLEADMLTE
jgi:hypothetical protein